MKNKFLFFYILLSLFYCGKTLTGDLTKTSFTVDIIEKLMATAGISKDSKEATRIRQLVAGQIDFLVKCTKTLKDYENNIDQMSKYKESTVTRDNRVPKIVTIDKKGSCPYVKDNRFVTTTGSLTILGRKKEDDDVIAATFRSACQKNGNLALLLTEISTIALALSHLSKVAGGTVDIQQLKEDPSDSLELKTLKSMFLYLHYEYELFHIEVPVALSQWTIRTDNPTALGFLEYAYEKHPEYSINQKERDILMAFIKTQPYASEIIDKTIESIQINYKYINDARWDESAFSKKSRNSIKTLINNFMAHSTTFEKIYDTNRSHLASKKQINLLKKYSPLFNDVDLEAFSILPARLLSKETNEIATKTAATVSEKSNSTIPKEKSPTNNKKKKNNKGNNNKTIDNIGKKNQIIKNDDQSNKENLASITKTIATKNTDNVLPITAPQTNDQEDLTTKFLKSLPAKYSIVHYHAQRLKIHWRTRKDGYHDVPHITDAVLLKYGKQYPYITDAVLLKYEKQYPFEQNQNHISYCAPARVTDAQGNSRWGILKITSDGLKIYHREFSETYDIFNPLIYTSDYNQSYYELEYPDISTATTQQKSLTGNNISVDDLLADPDTIDAHGIVSILSKKLRDGKVIEYNKSYISIVDTDPTKNRKYEILLKQ